MTSKSKASALHKLADMMGILPSYFDQTGKERTTSDETRTALLAAMRIDASSERSAEEAVEFLRAEEEPHVRVSRQSGSLDVSQGAHWELELELESGETRRSEGRSATIPLTDLPLGYHVARLTATKGGKERRDEQLLIIVPPRCA